LFEKQGEQGFMQNPTEGGLSSTRERDDGAEEVDLKHKKS